MHRTSWLVRRWPWFYSDRISVLSIQSVQLSGALCPEGTHYWFNAVVAVFKFLMVFEQGTPDFPFKLSLVNYVASPGLENWLDGGMFHRERENRNTFWGKDKELCMGYIEFKVFKIFNSLWILSSAGQWYRFKTKHFSDNWSHWNG